MKKDLNFDSSEPQLLKPEHSEAKLISFGKMTDTCLHGLMTKCEPLFWIRRIFFFMSYLTWLRDNMKMRYFDNIVSGLGSPMLTFLYTCSCRLCKLLAQVSASWFLCKKHDSHHFLSARELRKLQVRRTTPSKDEFFFPAPILRLCLRGDTHRAGDHCSESSSVTPVRQLGESWRERCFPPVVSSFTGQIEFKFVFLLFKTLVFECLTKLLWDRKRKKTSEYEIRNLETPVSDYLSFRCKLLQWNMMKQARLS